MRARSTWGWVMALGGLLAVTPAACSDGNDPARATPCAGGAARCAWFEEVAEELGLVSTPPPQSWAAGVVIADFDGDGRADLARAGADHVRLWVQDAGGAFHDASATWGTGAIGAEAGLVAVDFDGDAALDLVAASVLEPRDLYVLHNDGGRFTDVTGALGYRSRGKVSSTAWADYDRDGDLDLFVARYSGDLPDELWRNDAGTALVDVTAEAGVAGEGTLSFQPVWLDADDDGDPDLYVANDKASLPSFFLNLGDGAFADFSLVSGVALAVEAMGATADDLNGDGILDIYVGNVPGVPAPDVCNLLHLGDGLGRFVEVARAHGASVDRWTWGVGALDADLDGDLDLYVAVEESGMNGLGDVLLENVDGRATFADASGRAGVSYVGHSFGLAVGDVDGDGRADVAVTDNRLGPPLRLYRARPVGAGHWLKVRLAGAGLNRFGVGARVVVEAGTGRWVRELRAGEWLQGGGPPELLFGLGARDHVDRVTVYWPSGPVTRRDGVAADAAVVIAEE